MTDATPASIGKYEVKRELGRGATSVVYLARDPFADRDVAIKMFSSEALRDPKLGKLFRKQLYTEAALAGKLVHPHIVAIYDAVVQEDTGYVVMEYVGGGTLERYTHVENLLPPDRAVEIIFKCCKALEFAHTQGVIHRDIKPANIMLGETEDIKISDFGAALMPQMDTTQVSGIGSPAYMSPQQVKEFPLNHQTDIWSVGVVFYQLLTGRLPFQASSNAGMIYQILNIDPTPPSALRENLPPAVDAVVARALQRDLDARYQNWEDFAHHLVALGNLKVSDEQITDTKKFNLARKLPFFKAFSDVELWEVLRISRWKRYPAHAVLVSEGAPGESFFILAEGEAKVTKGKRLLNILNAGDCFGEMSYLSRPAGSRTATVETITDTTVMEIDAAAVDGASENCQLRFSNAFLHILVERLDLANTRLSMLLS